MARKLPVKIPTLKASTFSLVDEDVYKWAIRSRWYMSAGYPATCIDGRNERLHSLIMGYKKGFVSDHVDGDPMNNLRSNLRWATYSQNCRNSRKPSNNTSGIKGVSWHKHSSKWRATIATGTKIIHLGLFEDRLSARLAYIDAVKKFHGEFARFN